MFYDAAGPSVEIQSYLTVKHWNSGNGYETEYMAGVRLNVGISFSGWFKKITGLHDWFPATLFDWELWMQPPRPDHDIAIANIRSEGQAFVSEEVTVSVDVANLGRHDENVEVALYYQKDSGDWVRIENKTGVSVPNRTCKTLDFIWNTPSHLGSRDYSLKANATVDNDNNSSNDYRTHSFKLYVQDVAVVNLTADETSQTIEVTIENAGTGNLSSVVVHLYYNGSLAGDDWWDYMRMAFNLQESQQTILNFSWNTTAYNDSSKYYANATRLPYEIKISDNIHPRLIGDVNADRTVDLKDVLAVALAYGSLPGHPRWNPNADINNDNKVDLSDYYATVLNYGKP